MTRSSSRGQQGAVVWSVWEEFWEFSVCVWVVVWPQSVYCVVVGLILTEEELQQLLHKCFILWDFIFVLLYVCLTLFQCVSVLKCVRITSKMNNLFYFNWIMSLNARPTRVLRSVLIGSLLRDTWRSVSGQNTACSCCWSSTSRCLQQPHICQQTGSDRFNQRRTRMHFFRCTSVFIDERTIMFKAAVMSSFSDL